MRDYMIRRSFRGLGFVAPMLDTGATGVSFTSGGPTLTAANPPSKATPTGYATPGGGLTVASDWRAAVVVAAEAFHAAVERMAAVNAAWGASAAGRNMLASARSWVEAARLDSLDRLRARLAFFGRVNPMSIGTREPGALEARATLIATQDALIAAVRVGGAPPPTTSITKTPSGEILGASAGPRTAASFPGTADSPPVVPAEDPEALAAAERTTTSSPDLPAAPVVYSSGGSTSMSWESLPPWARVAILLGVIGAGAGGAFLFLRRRPRRR